MLTIYFPWNTNSSTPLHNDHWASHDCLVGGTTRIKGQCHPAVPLGLRDLVALLGCWIADVDAALLASTDAIWNFIPTKHEEEAIARAKDRTILMGHETQLSLYRFLFALQDTNVAWKQMAWLTHRRVRTWLTAASSGGSWSAADQRREDLHDQHIIWWSNFCLTATLGNLGIIFSNDLHGLIESTTFVSSLKSWSNENCMVTLNTGTG